MRTLIKIIISLLIGIVIGVVGTIFVYPFIFPPPQVNESIANIQSKQIIVNGQFIDPNSFRSSPLGKRKYENLFTSK